mmetsp:Transcript_12751/g.10897  ORF Transcript_12751/g.10897 Transcript_12751/m.10897 type:complete len:136 (-) Transcript_12751:156-563(-)
MSLRNYYKVAQTYSYYSYLNRYDSAFLRKYQSEDHYVLGQKSLWRTLVLKFAADHISLEEEHSGKYKTPMFFVNISYRLAIFLMFYMIWYTSFYLDDVGRVFSIARHDYNARRKMTKDKPVRYEKVYRTIRPIRY